jgi:hypothetical protein
MKLPNIKYSNAQKSVYFNFFLILFCGGVAALGEKKKKTL